MSRTWSTYAISVWPPRSSSSRYAGQPGVRGHRAFERGLDEGILLRLMGDIIGLAPPFISSADEVRAMIESLRRTLRAIAAD